MTTLQRFPTHAPQWATTFGQDQYGPYGEFNICNAHFRLRWIPPGTFLMGSPITEIGRYENEGPIHQVVFTKGFWLTETPITQLQWKAVTGNNPSHFMGDHNPVDSVSWADCKKMIIELNHKLHTFDAHLPSEAQWEYACRAGTTSAYNDGSPCREPYGKDSALEHLGWFYQNSDDKTHPVRIKHPNCWGLYDMHGNVWEWCEDSRDNYHITREINPCGNLGNKRPALRGGSWIVSARRARSAYRNANHRTYRSRHIGLRLASGLPL